MTEPPEGSLPDRLRAGLLTAMRQRDAAAVSALRSALAAVENAEAVPRAEPSSVAPAVGLGGTEAERRDLSPAEVRDLVLAEVADRRAAAAQLEQLGRDDRARRLLREAEVLESHLAAAD